MRKLTKIKYLFLHPQIVNFPKYLALAGLFYSSFAAPIAVSASFTYQKPALLALADTRLFNSWNSINTEEVEQSAIVYGSAFISQANTSPETSNKNSLSAKTTVAATIISTSQNITDVKRNVIVTAYSSTVDQCDASPFITAKGTQVRDGIVAANWLPFGTKIRLPEYSGDKVYVVEDRMALKNSHKVDIWMPSRQAAMQFGVKRLTVEIVE